MKQGQSVIALLVGFSIGAILLVGLLRVLTNIYQNRNSGRRMEELVVTSESILNELTQEIHWSERVSILDNGHTLVLEQPDQTQEEFRLSEGVLLKNNSNRLNPQKIEVSEFFVENRSPQGKLPILYIKLSLKQTSSESSVILEKETAVSLRQKTGTYFAP